MQHVNRRIVAIVAALALAATLAACEPRMRDRTGSAQQPPANSQTSPDGPNGPADAAGMQALDQLEDLLGEVDAAIDASVAVATTDAD